MSLDPPHLLPKILAYLRRCFHQLQIIINPSPNLGILCEMPPFSSLLKLPAIRDLRVMKQVNKDSKQ